MNNYNATIITIGDELLIGQTIDTNSAWIANQLNNLGINILRRVAIADNVDAIINTLNEEKQKVDLILITGGLGPTSDDLTKPLLCDYFGSKLVINKQVEEHIRTLFSKLKRPIIERNLKQAEVPDNCIVLFNRMGTAPGMWFNAEGKIFIAMPGVPFEMKAIMEDEVLPKLKSLYSNEVIVHKTTITAGEGESFITEKLKDFECTLPDHIKLAYLPDSSIVKLRLTGRGSNEQLLLDETKLFQKKIIEILGSIVIASDDLSMESILGNTLSEIHKTIGIAESCTGGYIGHSITQVPGASAYFMGSIVSYDNKIKENILGVKPETISQFGAVSENTAIEMALGALKVMNVDFSLSTTGVLGPGGGTERVETGTVWMAVASKDIVKTKQFHFRYDRHKNKDMATKMGILFLWKFITDKL